MADEDDDRQRFAFTEGPLAHHPFPPEGEPDLAYEHYRQDLNAKRDLWHTAQGHKQMIDVYGSHADAEGVTDAARNVWLRRQEKARREYEGAKAGAKVFGVDVEGPFPRDDAMMTRPYRPRSPGFKMYGTQD